MQFILSKCLTHKIVDNFLQQPDIANIPFDTNRRKKKKNINGTSEITQMAIIFFYIRDTML